MKGSPISIVWRNIPVEDLRKLLKGCEKKAKNEKKKKEQRKEKENALNCEIS